MAKVVDLLDVGSIDDNTVMLVLEPIHRQLLRDYGIGLFEVLESLEDKRVLDVIKKSIKKR